ncbi:MAG: phosphatidylglycerophosphatase A [Deltaproteobacteria bacterium]|nr:phosphatidylglycerophosphatase A [Deltaproteobacteria bacterium]
MAQKREQILDLLALGCARMVFIGKSPRAPGTCASLATICLAPLIFLPLSIAARLLFLALVGLLGVLACGRAERLLRQKDPPQAVIDEFLGQLTVCLPFSQLEIWHLAAAFVLFRIFDISKPWPVNLAEKAPGGLGVMLDDLAAGLYAMACLALLRWAVG